MKNTATILLVEDDQALLDGIADLLEISDIGYAIDIMKATNGFMGLEAIKGRVPDLIISDIMMPRMGGFEFLEQLRKKPEWVHIPVIFLTAKGTTGDILKGRLSGAELYITKPYESDELLQLVKSQLKRAFELRIDRQRRMDRPELAPGEADRRYVSGANVHARAGSAGSWQVSPPECEGPDVAERGCVSGQREEQRGEDE